MVYVLREVPAFQNIAFLFFTKQHLFLHKIHITTKKLYVLHKIIIYGKKMYINAPLHYFTHALPPQQY